MLLRDLVTVAPRYARSINIERDAGSASALDGYIITATAQRTLARIAGALGDDVSQRAWTITGPYGSGKSAFALFVSSLLGFPGNDFVRKARALLKQQRPQTHKELFERRHRGRIEKVGFCSILVGGSAGPILPAIAEACSRDFWPYFQVGRPPAPLRELDALREQIDRGEAVDPREIVRLISRLTLMLQETGRAQGVLLVIDELGKFLEFAASDERGDIFVLQLLAEATGGTGANLLLVTVLHQAFEQYAANLATSQRAEWAKIQGRFEDVAYQAPPEEIVDLLAAAIQQSGDGSAVKRLRGSAVSQAEEAWKLGLAPRGLAKREFLERMQDCAPLHPATVLSLARLCRKFGQNHRSLFSFLVAREPYGFVEFLDQEFDKDLPCYRLENMYDYTTASLGSGLNVGDAAARWAEVQNALDRAASCSEPEIRIIKHVGLMSAIGGYGDLKPSLPILGFTTSIEHAQLSKYCAGLVKKSLVVERRYNDTIGLWEGSDIDLEAQLRHAARRVTDSAGIAERLNETWRPRPIIAKRHSYKTGTLRNFEVRFADAGSFSRHLAPAADADGILIYCIPSAKAEARDLAAMAASPDLSDRQDILIAIPAESRSLRDAVHQLELLRWVQSNTPELQSDGVARRELRSMLAIAERTVTAEVQRIFTPGESKNQATQWFHHGMPLKVLDTRRLSSYVSTLCDEIYKKTPTLRNELINRKSLSSAAAAARRNLIDAMIRRGAEARLGLTGFPPEVSIYASLLEETGIHREGAHGFEFGPPKAGSSFAAVWRAIEAFLERCEVERRPVDELFALLQDRPYGLRAGVLPILLCAAMLHFDSEVAFYEDGSFVPEVSIELFERLLKNSDRFHLRRYRIEGVRKEVFREMAAVLGASPTKETRFGVRAA
jgi:hypothetical protein